MAVDMRIDAIVEEAFSRNASDIHLVCGLPPKIRVNGSLENLCEDVLESDDCERLAIELAGSRADEIGGTGEWDLAKTIAGQRIRINLFRQQGHISAALRILSDHIPDLASLGLPSVVQNFAGYNKGIVLITGETGSGKSTTLAALLDRINHTRNEHIITLEDPIEYVYEPDRCLINQREIGKDTESYANGLRAILREDPDIILVGEMRDASSIEIAITAAETGHLVFSTLHTNSAVDCVDRMVGVFPADRHAQIRMQLSTTLRAVVAQQLLPRADGNGRVLACEVMVVNAAIRNLIREGKTPQMQNALLTSAKEGCVTMDNYLIDMAAKGVITPQQALAAGNDADLLKKRMMLK